MVNEAQYELGEIGSIKTHGAAAPRIVLRHVIGPFSRVLSSISSISRCIDTRPIINHALLYTLVDGTPREGHPRRNKNESRRSRLGPGTGRDRGYMVLFIIIIIM